MSHDWMLTLCLCYCYPYCCVAKGLFTHQSLLLFIHMHGHSLLPFICCLLSLFNDIRSILDIQSHCVVMGASPLISMLFIHSHVTRYLVFLGGGVLKGLWAEGMWPKEV